MLQTPPDILSTPLAKQDLAERRLPSLLHGFDSVAEALDAPRRAMLNVLRQQVIDLIQGKMLPPAEKQSA